MTDWPLGAPTYTPHEDRVTRGPSSPPAYATYARKWDQIRPEAIVLLVLVILSGQLVFNGNAPVGHDHPLEYLCMPFLAWAAMRFGQRETAVYFESCCSTRGIPMA